MAQGSTESHFGRFNALVENGWLVVLDRLQLSLWMAYEKHATKEEGLSWPDRPLLARYLGHMNGNHIGEIRKTLEAYGLIRVVEVGGGRGRKWKVKMLAPPAAPVPVDPGSGLLFETGKGPDSGTVSECDKRSRIGQIKGPESDDKRSLFDRALNKDLNREEQTREQHKGSADKPRGRIVNQTRSAGAKRPRKRATEPELSPAQRIAWDAFRDWWTFKAVPGRNHGIAYEWAGSRDGKALKAILSSQFVAWDLVRAKALAEAFLDDPDPFLAKRGKPLFDLAERLNRFAPMAARKFSRKESGTNGHAAADEYAIPVR